MNKEIESKLVIVSEVLFVLLPIIVICLVHFLRPLPGSLFKIYEWSFASIVLYGQTIVKFASGISNNREAKSWQLISSIFSALIVLGLIPSIVILALLLLQESPNDHIYYVQMILFVASIIIYFFFGTIGQMFLDTKSKK